MQAYNSVYELRRTGSATYPYSTAHMDCETCECGVSWKVRHVTLTVALRLIPTVLVVTAQGCCAYMKKTQKRDVSNVLPASDHLRPSFESTSHAPIYRLFLSQHPTQTRRSPTYDCARTSTDGVYHHVP